MSHPIPDAAFDKHVALLGMTGAGKTSVIKTAIVEPDLAEGRRVLIITPKDDWWGLRLSKTGKSAGFDIPIFGGRREDYPLNVKDAPLLADAYGTMRGSAIFCTSKLSVQDRARWFAAFAERLLSANRGWVRVVIDEAHVFMPKQGGKGGGAIPAALHAGNELVSQGRSQGLRIVLASQRSAKLHNDSLTQCSCLFAMLLMAPHDRDAVKDWIEDQADPQRGREIISSLATLSPGQAWVWAPAAKFLECVQFQRPSTFDSSKAPDDDGGKEHMLPPINLDALRGKLATVEAERKANDPAALKSEVAKLRAEKSKLEKEVGNAAAQTAKVKPDRDAIEKAEKRGFERAKRELAAAATLEYRERVQKLADQLGPFQEAFKKELFEARRAKVDVAYTPAAPSPAAVPRPASSEPLRLPSRAKPPALAGDGTYTGPQRRVLTSLAMWRSLGHDAPTREMVAAVAGYSPTSGGFANLLGSLKTPGAIDYPHPGRVSLMVDGIGVISKDDGRDLLLSTLSNPQKKIVAALVDQGARSRAEVGEATGYSPTSGGYANLLGSLRTIGLIDYPQQGSVAMSEWAQELLSGYAERIAA